MIQTCTYLIDHSPLGLFRANETNNWNELNRLRIHPGRRQTSWLCTSAAEELNQGLPKQIQLVVRAGLELRISRFKSGILTTRATLPPLWSLWSMLFDIMFVINFIFLAWTKCFFLNLWKVMLVKTTGHQRMTGGEEILCSDKCFLPVF